MPVQTVIKNRRDTAANWTSTNPVLSAGEFGLETDTNKLKFGNGSTAWNSLAYASGAGGVIVSETAPSTPESGMMWFSSSEAKTYIYYDSAWVELSPAIAGPAGANGTNGADGAAATITVGTTTTGAAGSSASVTNSGTSSAAVFDFTIPRGDTGATGATGATGPAGASGIPTPVSVSSNITLATGSRYFVDTTAARTLTLPASPVLGNEIQVFDATGSAGTNNITIANNSQKINGVLDSALLDVNGVATAFIYTGSTYGWRMG